MPEINNRYDYIIVGAGSAGCTLAYRLSTEASRRVLLLEAGGKDSHPMIHIPLGFAFLMKDPKNNWCYETEPEPEMNMRRLAQPRGKVLGGSSSINGMLYVRGQKGDYDRWAELGNEGWDYDSLLPYFKRSEHYSEGACDVHGAGGPLWVEAIKNRFEMAELFVQAAMEAGHTFNDDFNHGDNEGAGYYAQNIKNGKRFSTAKAFLSLCKERPNLDIAVGAHATQLLFEGDRVTGIEYQQKDELKTATAKAEVILSGGTINSPQLLELSGIGNRELLEKHGIEVRHHLPGVGENLQDHLTINLQQGLKSVNTFYEETRPLPILKNIGKFFLQGRGLLTHPAAQAGVFFRADETSESADAQIHFAPAAGEYNAKGNMVTVPGTTATVCYLNPTSRGSVHIRSRKATDAPRINANYLTTENDRQKMIAAFKKTRAIFESSALDTYRDAEILPGPDVQSDEQILEYIREQAESVYHPVGTCKMGSDEFAVVDHQLKVHGIENLRIADASVMPTIVSGNTHAAAVMIAERCAEFLLDDWKP